jgi:hypothetical protein
MKRTGVRVGTGTSLYGPRGLPVGPDVRLGCTPDGQTLPVCPYGCARAGRAGRELDRQAHPGAPSGVYPCPCTLTGP